MTQPSTDEISLAAEYFIASECYRRGWVCSIVIGNAKTCDLHVSLPPKSREVKTLEVKSKGPKDGMWTFGKKGCASKNLIYVLVDYRGHFRYHIEHEKRRNTSKHWRPKCYIIPSREMHKYWKKGIGLGQKGGVTLASIRDEKTLHEKWTNIFDDGMPDGFSSRSFNSQLWDKARSEAAKDLNHARKKDGTWRKGYSQSVYMTKLNQIAKKHHSRLKKEIIE